MLWELLAIDVEGVEGVEGVGAIGAVLEEVLLGLVIFFAGLVLAEAVASSFHACRLDSEDKIIIVLTVEERHQTLLPGKTLVDEKVLLVMAHWVAEVDIDDLPPVRLELFLYYIVEVLVIHGIVGAECGGIIIIDDGLVGVVHVVGAEVGYECGNLALEFDIEGLDDIESVSRRLSGNYPVDVGVVVHSYANWSQWVHILVGTRIKAASCF